jgi:hypothetical protein
VLDHLGSVAVVTDAAGSVVQRLSYDAWNCRNGFAVAFRWRRTATGRVAIISIAVAGNDDFANRGP